MSYPSSLPWIVDGVALCLILGMGFVCLAKGAIRIVGSIAGFVAAVVIAWRFTPELALIFSAKIKPEILASILAFLAILVGVMAVIALLAFLLTKLFEAILLGWLNKLLGFVIGLAFGIVIVIALVWVSVKIYPPLGDLYSHTLLVKVLVSIILGLIVTRPGISPVLPSGATI